MLKYVVTLALLGSAVNGPAQGVSAGSDWSRVAALPAGTKLHLKAAPHAPLCTLKRVEPDRLTCQGSGGDLTYTRAEIKTIQLTRRGISTAVIAGVGAGVGVATVGIVGHELGFPGSAKASVFAGGAGAGAAIFAPIGFFTDPLRGPLVYKAP